MKTKKTLLSLCIISISLATLNACSSSPTSGNVYSAEQTGVMQEVQFATVIGIRNVTIEKDSGETGETAGAIIGATAGSEIGKGKGRIVGGVIGAVAGGAIGGAIDRDTRAEPGIELTLRMNDGRNVAIVQLVGEVFRVGETVKVLTGSDGQTRVTH